MTETLTGHPLRRHHPTEMWYRDGTYDAHVIGERRSYVRHLCPRPDDVLLDVGANIGAVSVAWLEAGASVIAFEPEEDNCTLLRRNLRRYDPSRATIYQAAVGGIGSPAQRSLWKTTGSNYGIHSTVHRRGRVETTVRCLPLGGMWDAFRPTVVKIDIEGGEYELLADLTALPAYVRGIAVELHLTRGGWRTEDAPRFIRAIERQGLIPVRPPQVGAANWTTLGVWARAEEGTP